MQIFEMPEAAAELVDFFLDPVEQKIIRSFEGKHFTAEDLAGAEDFGFAGDREKAAAFLTEKYRRGVISKVDETGLLYRLNNFYGFLDVFCTARKEEYDRLTSEQKHRLDDWYLDAYVDTLDTTLSRPTPDKVVPLEEMLEIIDRDPRPVYLNPCDCRSLTGDCGMPVRTCITWKNGINSFADRGISEQIDKERAKEIVREADRAGLMHSTMGAGICNCCGDCCYLFRVQRRLGLVGIWPESKWIASFDASKCIGCGKCVKRCHMDAFTKEDRTVSFDASKCVGCGICVNTCPRSAIELVGRPPIEGLKTGNTSSESH